jgi:hypothetical protein
MKLKQEITFSGPANYKISVQGRFTDLESSSFDGLKISSVNEIAGKIITILEGRIKDQTQLSSIINTLYEWKLPILLVKCDSETLSEH